MKLDEVEFNERFAQFGPILQSKMPPELEDPATGKTGRQSCEQRLSCTAAQTPQGWRCPR